MVKKSMSLVKKKISFRDLLTDCEIAYQQFYWTKAVFLKIYSPLKTKEDFTAWLMITRENIDAYNFPEYLVEWNYSKNSYLPILYKKFMMVLKYIIFI